MAKRIGRYIKMEHVIRRGRSATPTDEADNQELQNWLANRLKAAHGLLDMPYPLPSREIRGRAVKALQIIRELLSTFPLNEPKDK